MRAWIFVVLAGCGGVAWKPVVWSSPPADPKATPVAFEFGPGANGTELVLAVLERAKSVEAAGVSSFEIQVGACTRAVTVTPTPAAPTTEALLDRITLRVQEAKIVCRTSVDQRVQHGGTPGLGEHAGLGDAELVVNESCDREPIDHVVTRYRFELDAKFTPPDWATVEAVHHVRLAFGPPRCTGVAKNEVRAVLHRASQPAPRPPAPTDAAASIIELANRAEAAKLPGEATDFAERALAALAAAPDLSGLDEARTSQLADRIAAAHFFAVAIDIDKFLKRDLPKEVTDTWATEVGADIDRIAKRCERMKEIVRLPLVARWLRAGGHELAKLHEHVAMLLEAAHQPTAAASERAKAAALQ